MIDILTTLPTDSFVTAAFAELLDDVTNLLSVADGKDERAFWRRQLAALNKAQYHYLNGVRPQLTGDAYLMPSATSSSLSVYRLIKQGGILVCDCKAGQNGILCYHHMTVNVIERAAEMESEAQKDAELISGGGNDSTPDSPLLTPLLHGKEAATWLHGQQLLASRLSATAHTLDAMRTAQGRTAIPAAQHIAQQARHAYARANQPASRRPLFAERDAETFRRQALSEERAVLLEQRARRIAA